MKINYSVRKGVLMKGACIVITDKGLINHDCGYKCKYILDHIEDFRVYVKSTNQRLSLLIASPEEIRLATPEEIINFKPIGYED